MNNATSNSNGLNHTTHNVGDCVEFKRFLPSDTDKEYSACKGKIIDNSDKNLLEVMVFTGDNQNNNNNCWISPLSITNHYPQKIIPRLSTRLILKDIWKDLIFREVKTVKTKDQSMVTYQYVNDAGFVRTKKFESVEEAYRVVPVDKRKNIQAHYWDYFGFTTNRPVRNNDIYCNQEIFFSKKCYGELNLNNENITGGFYQRRGFNGVPPERKQYICGLVEVGEKGLFYRKWFTCSKEFLILWTMVCESEHYSLKNNIKGKYVTKSLNQIMAELDTSHYDVTNSDVSVSDKKKLYQNYNVETQAIFVPEIYQKIAKKLFRPDKPESDDLYRSYEDRFESDLMWMKSI